MLFADVPLSDLYRLEISTLTWSNLTASVRGATRPAASDGAGLIHLSGMLYLLGSLSQGEQIPMEFAAFIHPNNIIDIRGAAIDDSFQLDLQALKWTAVSLGTGSGGGLLQRLAATGDAVFTCGIVDVQNSGLTFQFFFDS